MNKRSLFLIFCALCAALTPVFGQMTRFNHYVGIANTSYAENGMQRVAEWDYYYYVDGTEESIALMLPIEGYGGSKANNEPRGYFRWYDYKTDRASERLNRVSTRYLSSLNDGSGINRGLFSQGSSVVPVHQNVGVTYTVPSDAASAEWEGDVIGCDISCNRDFDGYNSRTAHEPTLSIRYRFHILPAQKMANDIMNAVVKGAAGESVDLTYEDHKRIVFGAKDESSILSMRLNHRDVSNYRFHPINSESPKLVYTSDPDQQIKAEDFNTSELRKANYLTWVVYDETRTKVYVNRLAQERFFGVSLEDLCNDDVGWTDLNGSPVDAPTRRWGSIFYVVVYVSEEELGPRFWKNSCPIANYEVQYLNTYPQTRAELQEAGKTDRLIRYIEANYKQVMKPISFDDDNADMTLDRPTSYSNNASKRPSDWEDRAYAFVYNELRSGDFRYTPLHGEYGLYKSANVTGVSKGNGYYWWYPKNGVNYQDYPLYDRTHELNPTQYGHFLYVDASDESRPIAGANFKADLCAGMRLVFSAAVADFTWADEKPQVQFNLYGIIRDEHEKETGRRLIQSFSSGDFAENTNGLQTGQWYQVYGRTVIPKNAGAENFMDFRLVVDNMCRGTSGADYAIDDIRLYVNTAKVDVVQNRVLCPDETGVPGDVRLKLRAAYEPVAALAGNQETNIFFRFCDVSGNPVEMDYDGDDTPDSYGRAIVPQTFDVERKLDDLDGGGDMFEPDTQGEYYLILANRYFPLQQGEEYYVSVAYPDEYNPEQPGAWGEAKDVCSTYSDPFEIIRQDVVVTDETGEVTTTFRISCEDQIIQSFAVRTYLSTSHPVDGTPITLGNVRFDYFIGKVNQEVNDFSGIENLQQALVEYRTKYPKAEGLDARYANDNSTYYNLLKEYVDAGRLVLSEQQLSTEMPNLKKGSYLIMAIPIGDEIEEGGLVYTICPDPMPFSIRVVEDGPQLYLGFSNVDYPNAVDNRIIRLGLPHLRTLSKTAGTLSLPIKEIVDANSITFEDNGAIYVSDTNDPTWELGTSPIVANITNLKVMSYDPSLPVKFAKGMEEKFHEGYWYELNFAYKASQQGEGGIVSCLGETFFTLKIVPEYVTWNSTTANALNANWNNDRNWRRSSAAEIYKKDYSDYGQATFENSAITDLTRQEAYVPMRFTKVTIPDQTSKVYPDLGNIEYRSSNNIATKLTNVKGEAATENIQYDILASWDVVVEGGTGSGSFECEPFYGNTCEEIYLKPGAELRDQCYLVYQKAWVETALRPNVWYAIASPLCDVYAGDFYVPYADGGRQRTEAFQPINFLESLHSRTRYPFYQRNWDKQGTEVVSNASGHNAYDYADTGIASTDEVTASAAQWSHYFNDVSVPYGSPAEGYSGVSGFAIKAGDAYYPKETTESAIVRLPKADDAFTYYTPGSSSSLRVSVSKAYAHQFLVEEDSKANAKATIRTALTSTAEGNAYFLVGNPYVATLSMFRFLRANPHLERKVWWLEAGQMQSKEVPEAEIYEKRNDVMVSPMQAFIVKRKAGNSTNYVEFTSPMTIDRWLIGGETRTPDQLAGTSLLLSVKAISTAAGASENEAKVMLRDEASRFYSEEEDVELLGSGLPDVLQVYTVASDKAVAVNVVPDLNWLPLGVIGTSAERVELTVDGIRRIGQNVWLYDAATKEYHPLVDGEAVSIVANTHGRYFLATSGSATGLTEHSDASSAIACYSPMPGTIVVTAPTADCLRQIRIYGIDGKSVVSHQAAGSNVSTFRVASGTYVVHVTHSDGDCSFKVVVL